MEPVPLEGAVKEERFPHTGKSHYWQGDQPGQSRSLEASEENTATGFWRVSWRETCTGGCHCCQTPQPEILLCGVGEG